MRRLLIWITILTTCASLLLVGVRILHPDSTPSACLQLLAPTTGDVLTVDAATGAARLDARAPFPAVLSTSAFSYGASLSSDQTHVLYDLNVTEAGPAAYKLLLGKRSTTYRRSLTPDSLAERYVWSPDSQHIAFTEMRGRGANNILANLAIADIASNQVRREAVPELYDNVWFNYFRQFVWSPDSTLVALSLYMAGISTGDSTLALRPVNADHAIYVALPAERIEYITWSPDSQVAFVFTQTVLTPLTRSLYVIQRDGQIRNHVGLSKDFEPVFDFIDNQYAIARWSPDGQYFYLIGQQTRSSQIDIFNLNGNRILPAPMNFMQGSQGWATRPHTLIYLAQRGEVQALYTFDPETGRSSQLVNNVTSLFTPVDRSTPSLLAIISSPAPNQFVLHLISPDLTQTLTPFDPFESRGRVFPQWSPDNQRLLITSQEDTTYTLRWWDSSGVHQFQHTMQDATDQRFHASWLTNQFIKITEYGDGQHTTWTLDTHTSTLRKLSSSPSDVDSYVAWNDDAYVLLGTFSSKTLYRLSDGTALFSDLSDLGGLLIGSVAPDERAALFFRDRDAGSVDRVINLISDAATLTITNQSETTSPAWSPDGETFAFATIEHYGDGWTLNILSRTGKPLYKFSLPATTTNTLYQQLRWTNCE